MGGGEKSKGRGTAGKRGAGQRGDTTGQEAAKAAEEKVVTLQNEMGAMKEEFGALSAEAVPPDLVNVVLTAAIVGISSSTRRHIGNEPTAPAPQTTAKAPAQACHHSAPCRKRKAAGLIGIGLELGTIHEPPFNVHSIAALKLRLRQAFDSHPATSSVPITGISRKGKEGTSYRIRVGDEENVKKVKEHRE